MRSSLRVAVLLSVLTALAWAVNVSVDWAQERRQPSADDQWRVGSPLVPLDRSWLRWPLPASEAAYKTIDGAHLHTFVEELAAISRRGRDRGEKWWGRIQGMPADHETEL